MLPAQIAEKERLIYTICRFDHYFDSVNNKTAVYIAISTFVLAGNVTALLNILNLFPELGCYKIFQFLLQIGLMFNGILGVGTLSFLIVASIPFFTQNSNSLYYFGGIGSMDLKKFEDSSKKRNDDDDLKDLRSQVHILSKGLNAKFVKLKIAGILLFIQFTLVLILSLILLIIKYLTYGNL